MIYLDNAATTYPKPNCVYEAINYGMKNYSFNSGRGIYKYATKTFKMINQTREKIADFVNTKGDRVVFTSSATESLNNIIYGLQIQEGDTVLISPFEHNAIVRTLYAIKSNIELIPFDKNTWKLNENKLRDILVLKKPKAIIISHISNVTGFMLPYTKIFEFGKKFGTINVLDSAQGFGIYKVNTEFIDFVVFAGHKSLYAMFGIAGFVNISNYNLKKIKVGGTGSDSLNLEMPETMPEKYEAGSLNSVGIYCLNKSIDFLKTLDFEKKEKDLTIYALEKLRKLEKITIYCPEEIIPNGIISFNVDGYTSDEVGIILSEDYDICVRTGYHCAPFVHDFIDSKKYSGTIRISIGIFNTIEEIDSLINALEVL